MTNEQLALIFSFAWCWTTQRMPLVTLLVNESSFCHIITYVLNGWPHTEWVIEMLQFFICHNMQYLVTSGHLVQYSEGQLIED